MLFVTNKETEKKQCFGVLIIKQGSASKNISRNTIQNSILLFLHHFKPLVSKCVKICHSEFHVLSETMIERESLRISVA
jgi:hypothetical protein